jgi:hypothetical protein
MRYLRATADMPLTLEATNMQVVKWWIDAAFAVPLPPSLDLTTPADATPPPPLDLTTPADATPSPIKPPSQTSLAPETPVGQLRRSSRHAKANQAHLRRPWR